MNGKAITARSTLTDGSLNAIMSYDEVEIEDMTWNEKLQAFTYPCPCGDLFQITKVGQLH